jgi:hypothetical protein
MQIRQERHEPWRGGLRWAAFGALGLASACLNPDISDEPPISESLAALDAPDAGGSALEEGPDLTQVPSSAPPQPSIHRRTVRGPNPTRR